MPRSNHKFILVLIFFQLLPIGSQAAVKNTIEISARGERHVSTATAPMSYQSDMEYYLKKLGNYGNKTQNLVESEVIKFRSYPHLDRAYRLLNENRFKEARKEFEAYLTLVPDDIRARVSYIVLLDKMSLHGEVVAQSDIIIARCPSFIPAYFFNGLAYQRLQKPDKAYAAFLAAAGHDIRKEDRIFALSMAADLAISMQRYEDAVNKLRLLNDIEQKHAWFMKTGFALEKSGHLAESLNAFSEARKLAANTAEQIAAALASAEIQTRLNNREQARQAFEIVREHEPLNQTALRGLAHIAYRQKQYDEAEKLIMLLKRTALRIEDRELLANLYLRKQNYSAAIQELRAIEALQGKGINMDIMVSLAQAYESAGRFKESESEYRVLLRKTPNDGELYFRYGNLLIKMKLYNDAESPFVKAISLGLSDRQKGDAHRNLALIHEKMGRYDSAAKELDKSLRYPLSDGDDTTIRLAVLLRKSNKNKEALRYLDQVLAGPSVNGNLKRLSYLEKSAILEESGQFAQAASELENAIKLAGDVSGELLVRLAVLRHAAGNHDDALSYLDKALSNQNLAKELKRSAYREKGVILEQTGRLAEAALEYERVMALGDDSPGMSLGLAQLYLGANDPEKARAYFTKLLKRTDKSDFEACTANEGLGMLYIQQGQIQDAIINFSDALKLCGGNWQRHYYLGLAFYRSNRWDRALEQLLLADAEKKDPATLLYIALCHKELNRPGSAVHYLLSALNVSGSASKELRKQMYDTLGYIYADESAYDNAVDAFKKSLELVPDTVVTMRLANILGLDGKTEEAWQALTKVDPSQFPLVQQVEYNDVKASLLQKLGKNEEALDLLEKNQRQAETQIRSYSIGLLCQKLGQTRKAIDYLRVAYDKEPQNSDFALSLGYAYIAAGHYREAIGIFEDVVARNPDFLKVYEDLGYLYIKVGYNDQAVSRFRQVLDSFPVIPKENSTETERWEKDAHRIRGEISKLTKMFAATVYMSYRTGKAQNTVLVSGAQTSGGLTGQVGMEVSVRPPGIGFRDDRILELFGRVFGNLDTDSINYNDASTQTGFGLRYKLLKNENLWISAERLVKFGKDSLDEWLFRLPYSRGNGFEPVFGKFTQDYALLYGEVDYFTRSTTTASYLEARKGLAYTFLSSYMLIPYLVADTRWQTPFNAGGIFLEGGAGISLKYFFNSTPYENYRYVMDASINYKHGMFFEQGYRKGAGEYDTAILSLGFNF